jgi:DNA-binding response OmpR family regulator
LPIRHQQVGNTAQLPPFAAGKMTDDTSGGFTAPILNPAHPGGAAPLLLLAEDNEELRRFVAQTLSEKYTVLQAVDGQDAVAMAIQHVPDVVVSDLMMPRMDGFGLLDTLKNDIRTSHIPVLLLTAKTAVESRIEGLQHGADAYLGKPFQTIELFAWIDNLLESRRRLQVTFSGASPMASPAIAAPAAAMPSAVAVLGVLDQQFLDNLRALAEKEIDNDRLTPDDLARALHMSRSQLHRKLTALTGMSVTEYLRNYRLDKALELLQTGAGNVREVAYQVGFINAKHFSTSFKERFGKSPSEV